MERTLLEWCRRLVACRSLTGEGTRQIAELCAAEFLAPAGIPARLVPSPREGAEQVNLFAVVRGRDSSIAPLVLNTHLDTVPPGASELWTACGGDPYRARVEGERIYGLGTADTKLDFAAKAFALKETGAPRRDVYLVGTFGEEHGLVGAREMAEAALLPAGALAFVGEPSRVTVITAHKGMAAFELRVRFEPVSMESPAPARRLTFSGKAAHSSTPALGSNAITMALEWLSAHSDVRVAAISGGTAVNVVPATCDVVLAVEGGAQRSADSASAQITDMDDAAAARHVPAGAIAVMRQFVIALRQFADRTETLEPDYAPPTLTCNPGLIHSTADSITMVFEMRPPPGLALDTVRAGLDSIVQTLADGSREPTLELIERRANPGFRAPAGSETVELAMGALAQAGLPLNSGVKSGCTEAGIYAAAGLQPVVVGPGPSTGVIHAPNEYNFLSDVEGAARFYRALLQM